MRSNRAYYVGKRKHGALVMHSVCFTSPVNLKWVTTETLSTLEIANPDYMKENI